MAQSTKCGTGKGTKCRVHSKGSTFPPRTPGTFRVYGMRFCPFVHRLELCLHHKNLPHEFISIDMKSKPDWFMQKSPSGRVPVLEFDDKIISGSDVCSDYLDETYAQNKLCPDDPYLRAQLKIHRDPFGPITPWVKLVTLGDGARAEDTTKAREAFQYYEDLLKTQHYFGGKSVGLLDFHLYPWFERIPTSETDGRILDDYPRLREWASRMRHLPAVQAVAHDKDIYRRYYAASKSGKTGADLYDIGL